MKKLTVFVLAILLIMSLPACGADTNTDEKSNVTQETTPPSTGQAKTEYRDFDYSDYASCVPAIIMYYGYGDHVESFEDNNTIVYRDGILDEITGADESLLRFIEKHFPEYVFGNNCTDCVTLNYLGIYDSFSYFKVDINNISSLQDRFSSWKTDDEVYMIVSGGLGNTSSGEQAAKFNYFIRNFTQDATLDPDKPAEEYLPTTGGEITHADWNTYCTEKTISTEMYNLTVPDSWLNTCAYDIAGNGWDITFTLPSRNGGDSDCTLLELHLIWGDYTLDNLPAGNVEYLGALGVQDIAYLVAVYPYDLPDNEQTKSISQVLASVTPKEYGVYKPDAYPVGLPDYYADGFNDADSLIVSDYLCDCTFIGFNSDTLMRVEKNPYGSFFNIDVDGIGYFQVERCTTNYEYPTETYKLYCGNYYAEVICYSGEEYLLVNIMQDDITVLSDRFYFYTP